MVDTARRWLSLHRLRSVASVFCFVLCVAFVLLWVRSYVNLGTVAMRVENPIAGVLPQFFPAHWIADSPIVFSEFPSRIRVGYILRESGRYRYLLKEELDALNVSLRELHSLALENLSNLSSGRLTFADAPGGAEGFIAADDNFAAARILLPNVQKQFAAKLGDFLLVLPHRDDCFCWSLAQSADRQARHAKTALDDYMKDEYGLTPDILKVTASGFILYKAQDARGASRESD